MKDRLGSRRCVDRTVHLHRTSRVRAAPQPPPAAPRSRKPFPVRRHSSARPPRRPASDDTTGSEDCPTPIDRVGTKISGVCCSGGGPSRRAVAGTARPYRGPTMTPAPCRARGTRSPRDSLPRGEPCPVASDVSEFAGHSAAVKWTTTSGRPQRLLSGCHRVPGSTRSPGRSDRAFAGFMKPGVSRPRRWSRRRTRSAFLEPREWAGRSHLP